MKNQFKILLIFISILTIGCSKDDVNPIIPTEPEVVIIPDTTVVVTPPAIDTTAVTPEPEPEPEPDEFTDCRETIAAYDISMTDANGLIEGDIIPDIQSKGLVGKGAKSWINKTIHWYFKPRTGSPNDGFAEDAVERDTIRAAIQSFGVATGFLMIEHRTKYEIYAVSPNGLQVTTSPFSNSSYLGMQSNLQDIKFTYGVTKSIIHHELGHAVGLEHEFKRSDRDNYLKINYSNAPEWAARQFDISDGFLCGEFDIESIMMYPPFNFAIDKDIPVITLKDGSLYEYSDKLSVGDLESINIKNK